MGSKKAKLLCVFVILLALIATVLLITTVISLIGHVQQPTPRLRSGEIIYVETGGTHNIYAEDSLPLPFFTHDFTFINTETQAAVHSVASRANRSYSIGVVQVGDEIRRGRFGVRVATVYLEPGTFMVDFQPIDGTIEFILGGIFDGIFAYAIRVFLHAFVLAAFITVFLVARARGVFKFNEKAVISQENIPNECQREGIETPYNH